MVTGFFDGGAGGIRTHEPVRTTWFRVRPVMTTSIPLPICSAAVFPHLFPVEKGFGKNWRKEQQTYSIFEPGKTRTVTRSLVDETDSSPQDFECCTFDHSDNSPYVKPEILKNTEDRTTGQNSKIFTFLNWDKPAWLLGFRVDKTNSLVDHFESGPLWPLRYASV